MAAAGSIRAGRAYIELSLRQGLLSRGLRRASARLRAFSASVDRMGVGLLKIGAALAAPLAIGTKVFADFEAQMAKVATVFDNPEKHMARFSKGVREMSVEFGESTESLNQGLYNIGSASISASDALDVLDTSSRLATAGITDTATASKTLVSVLSAFKWEAERAEEVADILFQTVRKGQFEFPDLASSIGRVTTIAKSAGVPLQDVAGILAVLTKNGISFEEAVTSLRAVIGTFLKKPSEDAKKLAKQFDLTLTAAALRTKGLEAVFQEIKGMPVDTITRLFPNIRASAGVLAALGSMKELGKIMDSVRDSGGAMNVAYEIMAKTLKKRFARLKQAMLLIGSVIGEALLKPVSMAIASVKDFAVSLARLVQENQEAVRTFAKIVLGVLATGAGLLTLSLGIKVVAFALSGLATVLGVIGFAFTTAATLVAALLTPIGAVIAATVAFAGYMLVSGGAISKVLKWLGDGFETLKKQGLAAWQGIADALATGDIALAAKILWTTLRLWWNKGIAWLNGLWISFKSTFLRITTEIWYGALIIAANAWAAMESAWVKTVTFLTNTWTSFSRTFGSVWNKIQAAVEKDLLRIMALGDETIDLKAAQAHVDLKLEHMEREADKEATKTMAARDRERVRRLKEIEETRRGTVADLDRRADEAQKERKKQHQAELDASKAAVDQAREEWNKALAKAAGARAAAAADADAPDDPPEAPDLDKLTAALKDVGGTVERLTNVSEQRARGMDVTGTFNALVAASLGVGQTAQQRTAVATEKTAKNTKSIADQLEGGALAFG